MKPATWDLGCTQCGVDTVLQREQTTHSQLFFFFKEQQRVAHSACAADAVLFRDTVSRCVSGRSGSLFFSGTPEGWCMVVVYVRERHSSVGTDPSLSSSLLSETWECSEWGKYLLCSLKAELQPHHVCRGDRCWSARETGNSGKPLVMNHPLLTVPEAWGGWGAGSTRSRLWVSITARKCRRCHQKMSLKLLEYRKWSRHILSLIRFTSVLVAISRWIVY